MDIGFIKTERVKIDKLKPAEYNPRAITDKAVQGLSNSIDKFGLLQPIIWNKRTGNVVGGHQRLYDIINKGATETDVIVVDFSLEKEKSANIALNHAGISGHYDLEKLDILLKEIDLTDYTDLQFDSLETMLTPLKGLHKVKQTEDEWVGMPTFESTDKGPSFVVNFTCEEDRQEFLEQYDLDNPYVTKRGSTWSVKYPFQGNDDIKSLKVEGGDVS